MPLLSQIKFTYRELKFGLSVITLEQEESARERALCQLTSVFDL